MTYVDAGFEEKTRATTNVIFEEVELIEGLRKVRVEGVEEFLSEMDVKDVGSQDVRGETNEHTFGGFRE